MKKLCKLFLAIIMCLSCSFFGTGCDKEKETLNIYMPDGAPALAMSKLMHENTQFGYDTNYTVVSATNVSNYILNKSADIAIMPINMASKILKDGEDYKILATVTNGNLYIVGNRDISSLADLKGEVLGVIGQGNVPDLTLKYLFNENSVEYEQGESTIEGKVAIRYFSEASNLLPMLKNNVMSFGLLPEPAVSKLLGMASNYSIELDVQALWDGGDYPQAVLVAKNDICEDEDLIEDLLETLVENENWVLENPTLAVNAINANLLEGVVASLQNTITVTAIENCNIKIHPTNEEGEIARMKSYLEKIRTINGNAVGEYTDNLFMKYED